ncbi:MAG: L-threonylcarbamoyladenylate synthase [bacterium]
MKKIELKNVNIKELAGFLREGKVMVCPTDTVYGIICNANDKKAVDRLFKIKKRDRKKPIPIFIKDIKMAKSVAIINDQQEKYLKSIWPGRITAILKPKIKFPSGIGKNKIEIGLRIPKYTLINNLLSLFNSPITGTSANISGESSSTKIKEVIFQFERQKYQPDVIIDGGNLSKNKPSTIINLTIYPSKILRK